ncbi:carbamoyl phosphate synthase large subunit [Formosa sediminum]|uniref:Carbamoyl phosphate synthase large subunit n=1 Tax=Formosa sediminum TaxID=2594004 RepID=A0A516GS02_9FLAO|nr:ATP-grasp domain-containing protein [Formosa sediminum]QDO94301.1 carbamoyl phosphate synthase large subunit [Formosa sediminum]
MNILITCAGRRVSLVKAFQKELKTLFPEGKVLTTDFSPNLSSACHASDGFFHLPLISDKNYLTALIDLCVANNIKLIIPTIDTELKVLSENKGLFLNKGITPIISSDRLINICRDKRKTQTFFTDHNINVAKEYSKTNYKLPLYIKPLNGSRSVDNFKILKESDLTDYHFKNDNLIFFEYIDHNEYEEFTCDLYYSKHNDLKCIVPRKRITVRDGEVNKGITVKNSLLEYISKNLTYIEGAVGCLTAQFFKHKENDTVYGIEINARFGGGYPLSYLAGANYPKWIIQEYLLDKTIDSFVDWEDQLLMLRYDSEILVHGYKG